MKVFKVWAIIMVLISVLIIVTSCVLVNKAETETETEEQTAEEVVTTASTAVKEQIKTFEGFSPKAIWDNGAYTYGYGHRDESLTAEDTITDTEANALFEQDIVRFERAVVRFANEHELVFTQNEFDALVSFLFNLGENYLRVIEERSTEDTRYALVNYLISGEYTEEEMINEWTSYCHSNGEVLQGLLNRRTYEVHLFLYGTY